MSPTPEEKQNSASQQKDSGGEKFGQGINLINDVARGGLKNPFGKIGSRTAMRAIGQTALRGFAAFLAGPLLPVTIALISIFVLTFIIVFLGGGGVPNLDTSNQPE
jgi:hypothetical protein